MTTITTHGPRIWIKAPFSGETACFRKELLVTDTPKNAYIALAVDNFYELKINGIRLHRPFYLANKFATWEQEQSIYTQIGYSREGQYARIYDIKPYLLPGRNVLTVKVQSDEDTPELLIQGEIDGAMRTPIQTDSTWKCFPYGAKMGELSWENPYFTDASWPNSVDTSVRGNVLTDGLIDPFIKDPRGFYIAPAQQTQAATVFKQTINVPSDTQTTWLRLSSASDYDIAINGRLVYGTSMLLRYKNGLVSERGDVDALTRVENAADVGAAYPTAKFKRFVDSLILRNAFHTGDNVLTITVHPAPILEFQTKESVWLDGEINCGDKTIPIATDSTWLARTETSGSFGPCVIDSIPTESTLSQSIDRFGLKVDEGIPGFQKLALDTGIAFLLFLAFGIVSLIVPRHRDSARISFLARFPVLAPAFVLILGRGLEYIFAYSEQNSFFESPAYAQQVLWVTLGVAIVAMLLPLLGWLPKAFQDRSAPNPSLRKVGTAIAVAVLVCLLVVSAAFCYHGIGRQGFLADEYVSMIAGKSILQHGVPVFQNTGIIYTRSSLFHYLLAFFMIIGGAANKDILVSLPILWHLATIVLIFVWARQLKGNWAAMLAAALVALCPLLIYFAREIRFYSQFTFFTTLVFYLLWRSLQEPEKDWYKTGAMLAFSAAYLSQQFALGYLPAVLIVVALSGNLRRWFRGLPLASGLLAIGVMGLDALAYFKYCQTALPYIDSESVSPIALHPDVPEVLPSMLLSGYERNLFAAGGAYLFGAIWVVLGWISSASVRARAFSGRWTWWSYLFLVTGLSIIVSDLIVSRPTPRYIVHLLPMVLLTVACGIAYVVEILPEVIDKLAGRYAAGFMRVAGFVGCGVILFAAYRPVRTWNTGERNSIRDLTACADFLKTRIQKGDKVAFFTPEAALYELGRCDYMWRPKKGSIFKYIGSDGLQRERNSGAVVIDNADKLRDVLAHSNRLWLVVQTQNLAEPGKDTNGFLTQFVLDNFKVAYEPVSMQVLEWDRSDGHFRDSVHNTGYDRAGY